MQALSSAALLLWVSLRLAGLYGLAKTKPLEEGLSFAHIVCLAILFAPFKQFVEHYSVVPWRQNRLRPLGHSASPSFWFPEGMSNTNNPLGFGGGDVAESSHATRARGKHSRQNSNELSKRTATMPIRLRFYARTKWYALALPIVGSSCLLLVVLIFVTSMMGNSPPQSVVPTRLAAWFFVFAPLQVFFFILGAMVVQDRTKTRTRCQKLVYGIASAALAIVSVAAALDTAYGIGGYPMSYIGMATSALLAMMYLFYGYVARPARQAKGKGLAGTDDDDEESALLATHTRPRVRPSKGPRRPNRHGRRGYGTMAGPSYATGPVAR